MTRWAEAPETRDQMVLFPKRLDDVVPATHKVRQLDAILSQLDWSDWEALYHDRKGQPAIPPKVIASVLLYGFTCQIRTSRKLEEALSVRNDFRWLVEGRTIDHSTIAIFRKKNSKQLRSLFVKVCILALELGFLSLSRLGFDGSRHRANNRRSGTRTRAQLKEMRDELAAKFDELSRQAEEDDAREAELFDDPHPAPVSRDAGKIKERLDCLDNLLKELEEGKHEGEGPKRLPITDPDARVMPNKEGGFAPNYTSLATVDIASGMVVHGDVVNDINEDIHLIPSVDQVTSTFQPASPPDVLTDGLNGTGSNLAQCHDRGITVYSPCQGPNPEQNPAVRENVQQPVPQEQWEQLPKHKARVQGVLREQLDKSAFIYDAQEKCYWCPMGRQLKYANTTTEASRTGRRIRQRYLAKPEDCAACPLRQLCLTGKAKSRQINREQYADHQELHAKHMARAESQEIYNQRRHPCERVFAVLKQQFGLRQFLCRGLDAVRDEWHWGIIAFNLERLTSLLRSRAGPATQIIANHS